MAAFRNADGVPLNVSQAVQNDEDARNLAAHLRGSRRDPYYEPARSLSSQDEEVHEVYEALYDIVNNPENYTAEQINNTIVDILEEYIKPAVAQDGGNIAFMAYKEKIVEVQLQGACSGCPSSTMTLKNGILSILQKMLPTLVDDVVAINE